MRAQKAATAEQLAQAKRNFQVGTATITDTYDAQARFDLVNAQEITAVNDIEVKRRALQQIIGRLPGHEQLYIVGGLASSGFGRGPMAGKLLADLIHTGTAHPVLAEADPARCVWPRRR